MNKKYRSIAKYLKFCVHVDAEQTSDRYIGYHFPLGANGS